MKKIIIVGAILIYASNGPAQINAVTDTGEEVLLYNDGTWEYVETNAPDPVAIELNERGFTRDEDATFLAKSQIVNMGIWINPKKWSFNKTPDNEAVEFTFQRKGKDLHGMLISEKVEIPVETLKGIALQNARNAAPDIRIIRQEYRMVNDLKVLMMQMAGTIQGMKFTYFGYYYSNPKGTIQFLTYTFQELFEDHFEDIETFLNGLVELE